MERRYDLDWLRVIAFGLLIFYHIGMFFVPWGWHIKNNTIYEWLIYPMLFLNRWRMPLLFIISGMGAALSLQKRTGLQFSKERFIRLFIPLVFGILVIVPPQVYIERIAYNGFTGNYFDFWPSESFIGEYPTGNLSWHHLWFLPYIFTYSLILLPLFLYLKKKPNTRFINWLSKKVSSQYSIYLFILPLFLMESFLDPFFPITHSLFDDWFNFFYNLVLFLYGFIFITKQELFFKTVSTYYKTYFKIGIMAFSLFLYLISFQDGWQRHFLEAAVNQINMWSWLLTFFGIAAIYLNKKSKIIAYCNTAVYPFYILHQTVIVVMAYYIKDAEWNLFTKFIFLVATTFLICFILYHFIIRKIRILQFVMGVKPKEKASNKVIINTN
ncbi:Glucan biosynthesis protein [Flavobacterium sp. 9AF]|uniref:acyltransferase family protein n=1 Tax=Flavobacterium sp. 9AF TaxID=2653142 RepID=UPI0012F45C79|nr:acyltransferase family protein [Flavobacterium sp. 9AF]VXB58429.1 Glucan biosynthesis protein [Flavobacterium sp. 9AF]